MENPVNNFTRKTPQVICELNTAEEKKGMSKAENRFKIGSGGREGC